MTANSGALGGWVGKILLVYIRDAGPSIQAGVALESPRIERRDGEQFLIGTVPHHESDWASGLEVGVRWSEIVHFLVFETRGEYEKRISNAPSAWELGRDRSVS